MSVKDQEDIGLKMGDLVFYSGEVWKIMAIILPDERLNLKNTSGIRNGVSSRNVESLGRDTISGLGSNGASVHPLLKFKVGEHVCTKSGKFRTGKVTAVTTDKVSFEVWEDGTCKEVTYKANAVERTGGSASAFISDRTSSILSELDARNRNWEQDQLEWWKRYDGGHKSSRESSRKSREPEKKDSISMGELIEEEAKRLSREGSPPREGGGDEEEKKPKIKKRQGEW